MHAVGCQTWIILAYLAVMSHWCKHSFCESVDHKTGNGLEQTIAENKISYGRYGLERTRFHLALNIPSHRNSIANKHMRRVNHGQEECGKRPLMESMRSRRDEFEQKQVAPPPKLDKIIGGMNAVPGANPWQVELRMVENGNSKYLCGGTIITEYWILSAAHCFIGKRTLKKDAILVRLGDNNNEVKGDHEQEFKTDVLITHESYNATTLDYDLALIKIRPIDGRGIVFNHYVQPACLPTNNTEYEAEMKCHISGWGTAYKGGNEKILQDAVVPILSDSDCYRIYQDQITPRMFCAGYLSGKVDGCTGDSGGPFVCDIQGKYTAIGVISWGDGCAELNKPGVYVKVKEVLPWIKNKILH